MLKTKSHQRVKLGDLYAMSIFSGEASGVFLLYAVYLCFEHCSICFAVGVSDNSPDGFQTIGVGSREELSHM